MTILIQDHIKIKLEHGPQSQSEILDKRENFIKRLKKLKKNFLIKRKYLDLQIGLAGE